MIRLLFTTLLSGFLAAAVSAQPAKPMPGNPMAPSKSAPLPAPSAVPQTVVMPTTPTITPQMVMQSCTDNGACCEPRMGMMQRLSVLWTGRHCQEPVGCRTEFPGYQNDGYVPQYTRNCDSQGCSSGATCFTSNDCGRMANGFGVGRFLGSRSDRSCKPCPVSLLGRMKLWLTWRSGGHEREHCRVATPYTTPARFYFSDHEEPSYNCQMGTCSGAGGCVNSGPGLAGRSGGGFVSGLVSRIGNGGGNGACGRGGCGNGKEGCSLNGTQFSATLRYARDEKIQAPPLDVGNMSSSLSNYLHNYFSQQTPTAPTGPVQTNAIQQAGHQQASR